MPKIELEPFSRVKSLQTASRLANLVAANRDWLETSSYDGVVERYGNGLTAGTRNVWRIAGHDTVSAYLIYVSRHTGDPQSPIDPTPVGMATIIANQTVRHPITERTIQGTDLDYWLDHRHDTSRRIHRAVAGALMSDMVVDLVLRNKGMGIPFATTIPNASHQPIGFSEGPYMYAEGTPAALEIPGDDSDDPYGILKDGRLLQLYTARKPADERRTI